MRPLGLGECLAGLLAQVGRDTCRDQASDVPQLHLAVHVSGYQHAFIRAPGHGRDLTGAERCADALAGGNVQQLRPGGGGSSYDLAVRAERDGVDETADRDRPPRPGAW